MTTDLTKHPIFVYLGKIDKLKRLKTDKEKYNQILVLINEINNQKIKNDEVVYLAKKINEIYDMVRICSTCNKLINEGYVICGGVSYHCSEECLYKEISKEQWEALTAYLIDEEERTEEQEKLFEEYGDTDSYYTEWQ